MRRGGEVTFLVRQSGDRSCRAGGTRDLVAWARVCSIYRRTFMDQHLIFVTNRTRVRL